MVDKVLEVSGASKLAWIGLSQVGSPHWGRQGAC
jgi:hypothetical protein